MKLYFASSSLDDIVPYLAALRGYLDEDPVRAHVLVSYAYAAKSPLDEQLAAAGEQGVALDLFADSGAFSVMNRGASVDVHAYARWLQRYRTSFVQYANLDVVRDGEASLRNQRILEEEYGLTPLPVFHVAEDWSYLERYVERYPAVALGGGGVNKHVYCRWAKQCFVRAGQRRIHGFGITDWETLLALPWFSIDSSSWNRVGRYGRYSVFDERKGQMIAGYTGRTRAPVHCRSRHYEYGEYVRRFGVTPDELVNDGAHHKKTALLITLYSFLLAERWITARNERGAYAG